MDCIRGPHCSQRPRATRTTESAVRSRSAKTRVSSRFMPGDAALVGQVDEPYLVDKGLGHLLQDSGHQVGVGVDHHDGVAVAALGFFTELVADDVVHQGGLAHAGAGHVEVMAAQQVAGKADGLLGSRRGVAHQGAAADAAGRGRERP